MNLIKLIKNKILAKSFDNKVSNLLNTFYSKENSDSLVHNNGKLVREGGSLIKLEHDFVTGIYLRRMIMSKGCSLISAIHKRDHVWFLLSGYITISTKNKVEDFAAPYIGFSKSGTQRVIYAHEESIFQNVFQNPFGFTNLDELENYNYSLTKDDYNNFIRNSK
tara:strand:+ start:265 stop:756 length:492 start_codon:yes stop_codon:yes gene_type:complete